MNLHNTPNAYGVIARALHWWMALIVLSLIGLGLYMTAQPDGDPKWALYDLHKSLGSVIFLLVLARIAWRRISPPPAMPRSMPLSERKIAHAAHVLLYLAMLALPVTGYLDASLGGYHLSFFGLFDVPMLFEKNLPLFEIVVQVHRWVGYALALLILAHAGAALKHHFIHKDDVLRRMLRG